eukprot:SAG31_NODE_22915_length_515_cov_1.187500_2_plen_131_part_01
MLLLLLAFYVFAIAFIYFFGDNDAMHFGGISITMVTLFRMATFVDWTDLMYTQIYGCRVYLLPIEGPPGPAFPHHGPYCAPGSQMDTAADGSLLHPRRATGYGKTAAAFFIFFVIMAAFVILNLFVGVITA